MEALWMQGLRVRAAASGDIRWVSSIRINGAVVAAFIKFVLPPARMPVCPFAVCAVLRMVMCARRMETTACQLSWLAALCW